MADKNKAKTKIWDTTINNEAMFSELICNIASGENPGARSEKGSNLDEDLGVGSSKDIHMFIEWEHAKDAIGMIEKILDLLRKRDIVNIS